MLGARMVKKFVSVIAVVVFVAHPGAAHAQAPIQPNFRTEVLTTDSHTPKFSVTNRSEKTLTACTIRFSVSGEAKAQSLMNWDALVQRQGPDGQPEVPLAPATTLTRYLPHRSGAPLPDKVEVIAGIWSDGETFGEESWVKLLLDGRASLVASYEQAVELLQKGLAENWTREQYLAAINAEPSSAVFYGLRQSLEVNRHPRALKLVMQSQLEHFREVLSHLRPAKPAD
jgi:hypothetical protein